MSTCTRNVRNENQSWTRALWFWTPKAAMLAHVNTKRPVRVTQGKIVYDHTDCVALISSAGCSVTTRHTTHSQYTITPIAFVKHISSCWFLVRAEWYAIHEQIQQQLILCFTCCRCDCTTQWCIFFDPLCSICNDKWQILCERNSLKSGPWLCYTGHYLSSHFVQISQFTCDMLDFGVQLMMCKSENAVENRMCWNKQAHGPATKTGHRDSIPVDSFTAESIVIAVRRASSGPPCESAFAKMPRFLAESDVWIFAGKTW